MSKVADSLQERLRLWVDPALHDGAVEAAGFVAVAGVELDEAGLGEDGDEAAEEQDALE